ncbi:MAG TPA: DNA-formamidopyrimidine glycosylase [Haliea salexigens]|uniref:Formamidopyrimidine-DNA glycosylase n=1 Tax=Haliea salexigens TaxID=287487 RepID=A0A3C1KIY0_9GAMM|nr:DNA-formamidopyrimidine glycosylase [Haliea sp.]HAN26679.1 DNA-formamidopyrimidine glycosylase [Haliea salexigens]|tara:strand:- start:20669 stop:21481 length:813 start_codon:yes stop_codon:yes gene_type:complete
MPELPEVETTRRGVLPWTEGQRVLAVDIREARLRWPIPDDLPQRLCGQHITAVERRAKYLLFHTAAGSLLVHLGMSGSLRVIRDNSPLLRHDHVQITLASGDRLRYNDPRRFGCMLWLAPGECHPLLAGLGPEPLSEAFSGELLHARARGRRGAVKPFLMDGKVVVGVGNIYANEALFLAGIRPDRPAGKISLARYQRLTEHVKQVLTSAITQGGTTLRDFVGGDGKPGYFAQQLAVYGRGGRPCTRCARPLREVRLGQRSTVYCVACQR